MKDRQEENCDREHFKRGDGFSFPIFGFDQDKACGYSGGQGGIGTNVC